jgi:hypothetical protein
MPIGQLPDYHLGSIINADQLTTKSIYSTRFDYYTRKSNALKNKSFAIQLVYHGLNEKMLLGVEWMSQLKDRFFPYQIPSGQINVIGKELNRGLSLFAQTNLINTPKLMWKFRGNILFPRNEFVKDISNRTSVNDEQPNSYSLQCGIQNNIQIKHFTILANINVGLDKKYYEFQYTPGSSRFVEQKLNEIGLSYFAVNYGFYTSKNKLLKNLELAIQTRNIITTNDFSEYYQLDKYVGLYLNYKF